MEKSESDKLVEELRELVPLGPGPNDFALSRARAITKTFLHDRSANSITREKANSLEEYFGIWFSPRRWQRYGDVGQKLKVILHQDIHGLERGTHWPPMPSDQ